jgi:hypothetical protein
MSDKIQIAGDFDLVEAKLVTSSGLRIDLKKNTNIISINIYEDCQRNAISGEIMLQDAADYMGSGPIIGQEYFFLKIKTPSFESDGDIIDFTKNVLIINSVENRVAVGNNVNVYMLTFTTSELVKNQRTRVKESLKGTYSNIVEDMLKRVNCQKQIFLEPTNGVKRIVAPNISPFNVISMAMKQSTSSLSDNATPSYMFYETFKGYHFRSLASMYAQPISQTYTTHIIGPQPNNEKVQLGLSNIIDYEIIENSDGLFNSTTGVLASKLIVHNIYSKSFEEYTYNYFDNFNKEKHITSYHDKKQFPIFSDVTIAKDGSRSSDFPARTYLTSISQSETDTNNTNVDGTEPYAAPDPQNTLQERSSTVNQLEKGLLINITIHGNTSINAGDVVKLDIPIQLASKRPDNPKSDRFYQGVFLIKKIKHQFTFHKDRDIHTSIVTLVKDSLAKELDGPKDLYEPKPEKKALVYKDKETFYPQL